VVLAGALKKGSAGRHRWERREKASLWF